MPFIISKELILFWAPVLILRDLDIIYPSLYDLFNQNFTVVSKKNYARIAMGSTNNTFSLVNDGFKCIVLVDEKDLEQQKAPFLNRFEKHIISFEYLLDEKFIKEADRIYEMVQNFGKYFKIEKYKFKIYYIYYIYAQLNIFIVISQRK